jgi:hypothetical protein
MLQSFPQTTNTFCAPAFTASAAEFFAATWQKSCLFSGSVKKSVIYLCAYRNARSLFSVSKKGKNIFLQNEAVL